MDPHFGFADHTSPSIAMSEQTPDRSERAKCYIARDAFFACLDTNGLPIPEQAQKAGVCKLENDKYLKGVCDLKARLTSRLHEVLGSQRDQAPLTAQSDYFNQRRVLEMCVDLLHLSDAAQSATDDGG